MYAIKETKNGQAGRILNPGDAHLFILPAERQLADWLSKEQADANTEANSRLKVEYGNFTDPEPQDVLAYLIELHVPIKGSSIYFSLSQFAEVLEYYIPEEDAHWYEWPETISAYSYDTTRYEVVSVDEDGNELN